MTTEWTFVPGDPARTGSFLLWNPSDPGGLLGADAPDAVELVLPGVARPGASRAGRARTQLVSGQRVAVGDAIDLLCRRPIDAAQSASEAAWVVASRTALGLVARGRVLPWVSPDGWDTWRLDPLDSDDEARVDALAKALPAAAHCVPSATGSGRIIDARHAIRSFYDAVADEMLRAPAAPRVASSPVFVDRDRMRVGHLRHWVSDLAAPHCVSFDLVLQAQPPAAVDGDEPATWTVVCLLRSRRDPSLVIPAQDLWFSAEEIRGRFGDSIEFELLAGLRRAIDATAVLEPLLESGGRDALSLDDDALDTLIDAGEGLAAVGVTLQWPGDLVSARIERRVVVTTSTPASHLPSVTDLNGLLDVDWEFLLDGLALSADELSVLATAKRGVVPLRGRWVRIDRRDRERLMAPAPQLDAATALAAALGSGVSLAELLPGALEPDATSEMVEVRLEGTIEDLASRVLSIDPDREADPPPGLHAELRPYQRRGLAWLADLCDVGLGGCLADDMGLGKTVQVLALHALRNGPTLIVCPTSLLTNWEREARRFVPDARVRRYHGPSRSLDSVEPNDLVVTTYGVVRSDADHLATLDWDVVVADEAQHAKNPSSRTAKRLRVIPSRSRIALTGTPVENRLSELWSIVDWTVPGLLGPLERFRRSLAIPIERDNDPLATERLRKVMRPFLLRRRKTDPGIAPELPPKTELDVVVPLTEEQVSLYKATTDAAMAEIAADDGPGRHAMVLRLLTQLKQITNHPAQFLGQQGPLAARSGKLAALEELLAAAAESGEHTLVFTQYVQMGSLLTDHLAERGLSVEMLDGSMTVPRRQALVDRFQNGELSTLVLSLKAAGTGLNLTKATQVVHYDRWWNPAVEDQATDRAYRIGQDRSVTVHRLIAEGTVEDRVAELLANKRRLANQVVGSGEGWISTLDNEELALLLRFDDGNQASFADDGDRDHRRDDGDGGEERWAS